MTPADTMRAAVEALEGDIMNLPRGVGWVPDAMTPNERAGYAAGHRDARHAAVELVSSALSLLRSALEGGEPEGWKLVPVEPTEAMCRAAADCQEHDPEDGAMSEAYYCYKAMLASIPPNTPVEAGKVGVARGVAVRCQLCGYQHGHAIGCANNPVDMALAAGVAIPSATRLLTDDEMVSCAESNADRSYADAFEAVQRKFCEVNGLTLASGVMASDGSKPE